MTSKVVAVVVTIMICLGASAPTCSADSLYDAKAARSLFSDGPPKQVGDLVTVFIQENSQAVNSAQRTSAKSASASAAVKGLGTGINATATAGNGLKNNDTTTRQGSLVARMTAQVEEVLPNGDLRIVGTRSIVVNSQKQTLMIRGTVRPQDIGTDNSVMSGQIGNAEIRFDGSPDWQKKDNIVAAAWEGIKAFFTWLF